MELNVECPFFYPKCFKGQGKILKDGWGQGRAVTYAGKSVNTCWVNLPVASLWWWGCSYSQEHILSLCSFFTWLLHDWSPLVRCEGARSATLLKEVFLIKAKSCIFLSMHLLSVLSDFSEKLETGFFNISFVYIITYLASVASKTHNAFLLYHPIVTSLSDHQMFFRPNSRNWTLQIVSRL